MSENILTTDILCKESLRILHLEFKNKNITVLHDADFRKNSIPKSLQSKASARGTRIVLAEKINIYTASIPIEASKFTYSQNKFSKEILEPLVRKLIDEIFKSRSNEKYIVNGDLNIDSIGGLSICRWVSENLSIRIFKSFSILSMEQLLRIDILCGFGKVKNIASTRTLATPERAEVRITP